MLKYFNFLQGYLSSDASKLDTVIHVSNVDLPVLSEGEYFYSVIDYNMSLGKAEIIRVHATNPTQRTMTVQRGWFDTDPLDFPVGARWGHTVLKEMLLGLQGETGPQGPAPVAIDGGHADSNYGGTYPLNGGRA